MYYRPPKKVVRKRKRKKKKKESVQPPEEHFYDDMYGEDEWGFYEDEMEGRDFGEAKATQMSNEILLTKYRRKVSTVINSY